MISYAENENCGLIEWSFIGQKGLLAERFLVVWVKSAILGQVISMHIASDSSMALDLLNITESVGSCVVNYVL